MEAEMRATGNPTASPKGQATGHSDQLATVVAFLRHCFDNGATACALVGGPRLDLLYANAKMRAALGRTATSLGSLQDAVGPTARERLEACLAHGLPAKEAPLMLQLPAPMLCMAERYETADGAFCGLFLHAVRADQGLGNLPAQSAADGETKQAAATREATQAELPAAATPTAPGATFTVQQRLFRRFGHDIRNAIGSAKMGADGIVRSKDLPERVVAKARRASLALRRADDLLSRFGDLRLVSAEQKLPINRQSGALSAVVQHALTQLPDAQHKLVAATLATEGLGTWDSDYLSRALMCLIDNAARFGAAEHAIEVSLTAAGDQLHLVVANRGSPLDAAAHLRIATTTPESRLDEPPGDNFGWGFGLAFVRAVAHAHGGRLEYMHTAEQTRFTLIFAHAH